ncbi:TIGR04282 family arsenosugar biosynthesis glycosyltransferase [Kutzneria albida]|uniref:Glycosyltransferase involved in cell wall biogenesis n=1 Tax=Kutzneria albida DSM 43870 TaxID=1449976 RepID=W5W7C1_9PSEU|nr:DUF2064 domain-containing protein [Kutzneria albida]AHH94109.1 hypothetical protein KALB_734 [Kutzneria albida DSM 43870]
MTPRCCVLVVAKAPVPGLAKTRLCPPASPEQAADIAAAALLDTLDAVRAVPGAAPVVALTGDLARARRSAELERALGWFDVIPQRGDGFGARLAAAHADTGQLHPGLPVVQIGMDTPQVNAALLESTIVRTVSHGAALGLAEDGGWWVLGLRDPLRAQALREVPMSQADTGHRTLDALHDQGLRVAPMPVLSDVDTVADALRVAERIPTSRFAAAVAQLRSLAGGVR